MEQNNTNRIILIKDGMFWRAYEKSAMLFVNHLKTYKLIRKHFKTISASLVYLGFPANYLPEITNLAEAKGMIAETKEEYIEIKGFDAPMGFETWKKGLVAETINSPNGAGSIARGVAPGTNGEKEYSPNGAQSLLQDALVRSQYETSTDRLKVNDLVIDKIRHFPVAHKTPIECQQFIVELQNHLYGTV